MGSYSLTNKAVEDLSVIWEYTNNTWSEGQADKYYFMLLNACQDLADGKVKGKYYPEIQHEISGFSVGQHIIFYRQMGEDSIEIIRLLHVRMDLKNRIHG